MKRALVVLLVIPPLLFIGLAAIAGAALAPTAATPSGDAQREIPAALLVAYQGAAATCPGLPWQVLAAIGWEESKHAAGRADPVTGEVAPPIYGPPLDCSRGTARILDARGVPVRAEGPMQFLPSTFARWGRLAPGRTAAAASPHNAFDAIYSAAAYLCAGKPRLDDVEAAVESYNHSAAYVEAVLLTAERYRLSGGGGAGAAVSRALPNGTVVAGSGAAVVVAALRVLGAPYVWGGSRPESGFDCSGLVQWAYAQAGVAVPRTTSAQVLAGVPVPIGALAPGDLVFTRGGRPVHDLGHVAIYAGDGKVIVAPRTGAVVSIQRLDPARIQATRRIVAG